MRLATRVPKTLLLLGIAALTACTGGKSGSGPAWTFHTTRLASLAILPALPTVSLRWPQFLLAEGTDRFLWGERGMFRLATSDNGAVLEEPGGTDLTRGMDRPIAAARTPSGTLAVLDMAGRVAVQNRSGRTWEIEPRLPNQPAGLAVTESRVYILLQGELQEGNAVVAYGFDGAEAGRWGTMPADGIIQASLRGGGIAACPDGSIFYSYVNSPRILHLEDGVGERVRAIGEPRSSFVTVPARKVRRARLDGLRSSSVAPLVKLGLGASRVMSLLCTEEGLLLRQVAQPAGGGAGGGVLIEVWDPLSEELVGTIPVGGEVLLDARNQILYLGASSAGGGFTLERIRYRAERSRPVERSSEVAGR